MKFDDVKIAAAGRWNEIHRSLGVSLATTSHRKHTSCPGCGGKDRFRVTAKYAETGGWICSQGGQTTGGDGFALLGHVLGYSVKDQLHAVAEQVGLSNEKTASAFDYEAFRKQADENAIKAANYELSERHRLKERAAGIARKYMLEGRRLSASHPYMISKGLTVAYNAMEYSGKAVLILRDSSFAVVGCQLIFGQAETWGEREFSTGDKLFLSGTAKKGAWFTLDAPPDDNPIAICEGYATAASLYEPEINHKGAVLVAFDAGNITAVTESVLNIYPNNKIIIYADDDDAGIKAAKRACALSDRVSYKLPDWERIGGKCGSDFNDYLMSRRKNG